jgi:hypothetical protein
MKHVSQLDPAQTSHLDHITSVICGVKCFVQRKSMSGPLYHYITAGGVIVPRN